MSDNRPANLVDALTGYLVDVAASNAEMRAEVEQIKQIDGIDPKIVAQSESGVRLGEMIEQRLRDALASGDVTVMLRVAKEFDGYGDDE